MRANVPGDLSACFRGEIMNVRTRCTTAGRAADVRTMMASYVDKQWEVVDLPVICEGGRVTLRLSPMTIIFDEGNGSLIDIVMTTCEEPYDIVTISFPSGYADDDRLPVLIDRRIK
ncbi:hypothetical protein GCM10009570_25090 [Dietzia natronolimnaea]